MRIAFIETNRLTNELLRAVAGAAPNCVGYPDGVPESWRDGSDCAADATEAPVEWYKTRGKHPKYETRGGAGGGAAYPDHELDPAALLGPVAEPVGGHVFGLWGDGSGPVGGARHRAWLRWLSRFDGPADWPDERGDDEC